MTKDDAIRAMLDGKKVSHRFFTIGEWMTILDPIRNIYIFEDGVKIDAQIFFQGKLGVEWQTDWEIFEE